MNFREKGKKQKNLRVTRTLTSLFLILPGGKTLNTCATQALRYITEKIEIVICTDTVFSLFLFSWKEKKHDCFCVKDLRLVKCYFTTESVMSDMNVKRPKEELGLFCRRCGNFLETNSATTGHKSKPAVTFSKELPCCNFF